MNVGQSFLVALRDAALGRKRVPSEKIWRAFQSAVAGYDGEAEARLRLAALLHELEQQRRIRQPKSKKLWDRSAQPALPRWIELRVAMQAPGDERDHRDIAWPASMVFVSQLSRVGNLGELLAIRRFLAEGGESRCLVPVRERSLELFGDEKRLDVLRKGALFRPGRLSLDVLRCLDVAPPLTFEVAQRSESDSILVLENLHSYDSFRRYNHETGAYLAIAYGHGAEFYATVRDLPRLYRELDAKRLQYFGDLDAKGLEIAFAANRWLMQRDLRLVPASRWYRELVCRAEERHLSGTIVEANTEWIDWLPAELRVRATDLLAAGYRAPQELVGWERLAQLV